MQYKKDSRHPKRKTHNPTACSPERPARTTMKHPLQKPAQADLTPARSLSEQAAAEGWTADNYALALADRIRSTGEGLDPQRERLAQLASLAQGADQATSDELARHATILNAIFQRFIRCAADLAAADPIRNAAAAETYLHSGLKAQRAALAVMSALKTIRDGQTIS